MVGICFLFIFVWYGIRRINIRSENFWFPVAIGIMLSFALAYGDYAHLRFLYWIWSDFVTSSDIHALEGYPKWIHFIGLLCFFGCGTLGTLGLSIFLERLRYQRDLDEVGLKSAKGSSPRLSKIIQQKEGKTKLFVHAKAIGVDRFEAKKGDFEASFQKKVDAIRTTPNRKFVEILLCDHELTKLLPLSEHVNKLRSPYAFIVGKSAEGILVKNIRDIPHMLVAGVTGYGKSIFFKQMLYSLLLSQRLQLYLVDLKRVESTEFEEFPNVKIIKEEMEAVQLLEAIKAEMNQRYVQMEKMKVNNLDPKVHKHDLIIVAIDEASILFGKTKVSKARSEMVFRARELLHDLTKLARAAGIHVIVATQKPVSEALDTSALENLPGRMIFKMSSGPGSQVALGSNRAKELPNIKGRGIWRDGNKFIEIQAPFISPEELKEACTVLAGKINSNSQWNQQPMIDVERDSGSATKNFNRTMVNPPVGKKATAA